MSHLERGASAHIADVAGQIANLPVDTFLTEAVSRLLLDWLGCAIGGSRTAIANRAVAVATNLYGGDSASSMWDGAGYSPAGAAFVNGVASHALELDDVHNAAVLHPAVAVIPAAVATAEANASSGADLIRAIAAGYEVTCRAGEALGPRHYDYFHSTGTAGVLGAATAAAVLHPPREGLIADAIGTAGTMASGLWQFLRDDAMSKPIHAGVAAANGLLSASLANEGITGAHRILEGEQGMAAGMAAVPDWSIALAPFDAKKLAVFDISIKRHACCRHMAAALDATIELKQEHSLSHSDITSIDVELYDAGFSLLSAIDPTSAATAPFSVPLCMASAIVFESVLPQHLDVSNIAPEVASLMQRVSVKHGADLDIDYPAVRAGRVTITTSNGDTYSRTNRTPKGDPDNAMTRAELEEKFVSLSSPVVGETRATHIVEAFRDLSDTPAVSAWLATQK